MEPVNAKNHAKPARIQMDRTAYHVKAITIYTRQNAISAVIIAKSAQTISQNVQNAMMDSIFKIQNVLLVYQLAKLVLMATIALLSKLGMFKT